MKPARPVFSRFAGLLTFVWYKLPRKQQKPRKIEITKKILNNYVVIKYVQ